MGIPPPRQIETLAEGTLLPHQKINKLPGAKALTDKSRLWKCFDRMREQHGDDMYHFMPWTYILPEQEEEFEDHLRSSFADGEASVWILKPATLGRGNGIFLHRPTTETLHVDSDGVYPKEVRRHDGVACEYIDRPMLVDGFKFDLRLYVLVTSVHPLVVYLYDEGLARFATEPYDLDGTESGQGLHRHTMHLTNVSIQKTTKGYQWNQDEENDGVGSKWSLSGLKRRMLADLGEERTEEVGSRPLRIFPPGRLWRPKDPAPPPSLAAFWQGARTIPGSRASPVWPLASTRPLPPRAVLARCGRPRDEDDHLGGTGSLRGPGGGLPRGGARRALHAVFPALRLRRDARRRREAVAHRGQL